MNLVYLHTYIEVIRLGSFSEVAKRLSISQPAVSFQIQKLERDCGLLPDTEVGARPRRTTHRP
jgi:DNA-binding transcriptional LysR family regulator